MNTELQNDMESLKKDLGKFRDDLTRVWSDVGHYSEDNVRQVRDKLKTAMKDFEGIATQKVSRANEFVHEKTEKAVDASRELVTQKPLTTVLVSFAAGALAAFLLKNHNHE